MLGVLNGSRVQSREPKVQPPSSKALRRSGSPKSAKPKRRRRCALSAHSISSDVSGKCGFGPGTSRQVPAGPGSSGFEFFIPELPGVGGSRAEMREGAIGSCRELHKEEHRSPSRTGPHRTSSVMVVIKKLGVTERLEFLTCYICCICCTCCIY